MTLGTLLLILYLMKLKYLLNLHSYHLVRNLYCDGLDRGVKEFKEGKDGVEPLAKDTDRRDA